MNDQGNTSRQTNGTDGTSSAPCRCAVCGAEFPSAKGFRRRPFRKNQMLCPGCADRLDAWTYCLVTVFLPLVMIGVEGPIYAYKHDPVVGGLLFLTALSLTQVIAIVPHEIGHALAALAVGMRLFSVSIGVSGRICFVRQVFGCDVMIHSLPIGGHVIIAPKTLRLVRVRQFLAVLGGPLANVLLLVLGQQLLRLYSGQTILFWILLGLFYGNVLQLAVALFPRLQRLGKKRLPSDGRQLLAIPRMSAKVIQALHSTTFYYEAMEALQRDKVHDAEQWVSKGMEVYPDNSWGLVAQASILNHQEKYALAKDGYLGAPNQPNMTPELRANLWNNIAWIDLMLADPTLLEEADRLSRQALEELPWQPYVRGTRGSVLIELGQIDEGVRHVVQALRDNYMGSSKALNACYLAIAEIRRGDFSKALDYIDEAKKRDPKCPLLERAVKELDNRPRPPEFDSH